LTGVDLKQEGRAAMQVSIVEHDGVGEIGWYFYQDGGRPAKGRGICGNRDRGWIEMEGGIGSGEACR
jgi:hypothetical protein